jgi:hypothetical protein
MAASSLSSVGGPGELVLRWMSCIGEGSWAGFRDALSVVDPDSSPTAPVRMRSRISDLAYAEFFIGGTRRWKVLPPMIGGLADRSSAVLVGARTGRLVDCLMRATHRAGCGIEIRPLPACPDRVLLAGTAESIAAAAGELGIPFVPDLASALCAAVQPVKAAMLNAPRTAAPLNWRVSSFDFESRMWVDELLPNTAYEYRSRYGHRQHFLRGSRGMLLKLDKRYAVYGAASLRHRPLLRYDEMERTLSAPLTAPMPEAVARAAAGCSGMPAEVRASELVYQKVPPNIAGILMVAAGQSPPPPRWLTTERSGR